MEDVQAGVQRTFCNTASDKRERAVAHTNKNRALS